MLLLLLQCLLSITTVCCAFTELFITLVDVVINTVTNAAQLNFLVAVITLLAFDPDRREPAT